MLGQQFRHVHGTPRTENSSRSTPAGITRADCASAGPSTVGVNDYLGQTAAPDGRFTAVDRRGSDSLVRVAYRRQHQVLGSQRLPVDECAGWRVHDRHHDVWTAPRSPPSNAGGNNYYGQVYAPDGQFDAIARRRRLLVCPGCGSGDHLLGRQRARAGERARRAIRRNRRRPVSRVRPAHRSRHRLLGEQFPRGVGPTGRAIHRGVQRLLQLVRVANRPHRRMLGHQRARNDGRAGRAVHHRRHRWSEVVRVASRPGPAICWGWNFDRPVEAPSGKFSAVTIGSLHTCGLRTDGTIACWGSNSYGQTNAPSGRFIAVDAGRQHSCALRTDGTVECWGEHYHRQTDAARRTVHLGCRRR